MRLVILWTPPALLLAVGLLWFQAALYRVRHAPPGRPVPFEAWLKLVGAILLVVVGFVAVAWAINYIMVGNSTPGSDPAPAEVCC